MANQSDTCARGNDADPAVMESIRELIELERDRAERASAGLLAASLAEVRRRREDDRRAREESARALRAEGERKHRNAFGRRLQQAMAEASAEAEIQTRRLLDEHRVKSARIDGEHARDLAYWASQRPAAAPFSRSVFASLLLLLVGAVGVLAFEVTIEPVREAREELRTAETAAASDEPASWDEASLLVAVAKHKDPSNFAAVKLEEAIAAKRHALHEHAAADAKSIHDSIEKLQLALHEEHTHVAEKPNAKANHERPQTTQPLVL